MGLSEQMTGRVLDALGRPLDGLAPLRTGETWPLDGVVPQAMERGRSVSRYRRACAFWMEC